MKCSPVVKIDYAVVAKVYRAAMVLFACIGVLRILVETTRCPATCPVSAALAVKRARADPGSGEAAV